MKTIHLAIITITLYVIIFASTNAYAACIKVNGTQSCEFGAPVLYSIKSDKLFYVNSDKPVFTITGAAYSPVNLEIDNSSGNSIFSNSIEILPPGVANYTLDISSYKPGLYSAIASAAASKVSTNFRVSQVPLLGPIIAFKTMNNTYAPGDSIAIFGVYAPNEIILISLIDPNGNVVKSVQTNSDNIGQFSSDDLKIPINAISGIWEINATHGVVYGSREIKVNSLSVIVPAIKSPLQQFKSGIAASKVVCSQGFQLVFKTEDGSPACVKSDTARILIERGWAKEDRSYNMWEITPNAVTKGTSYCRENETMLDGGYKLEKDSPIMVLNETRIVGSHGENGMEIAFFNPDKVNWLAWVWIECR
ncbi:MAG: hypothetical protein ACRDFB_09700 [Rhabdochlamydiaceae bacterium]